MEQGNKIALVTGASRGLGKNMALNLAQQGTDIIVIYRSKEQEALEVVKTIEAMGRKAVAMHLDTANTKLFDTFFTDLQSVLETNWNRKTFDFLINNAGIDANSKFTDTSTVFGVSTNSNYFMRITNNPNGSQSALVYDISLLKQYHYNIKPIA